VGLKEMKAERILKLIERAREPLLKEAHIKAYAQVMIEKDRKRITEAYYDENGKFSDFKNMINNTPIILD
jgi:hypothetical protein